MQEEILKEWAVSPNFKNSKLTNASLDDKIEVFEDQIRRWILYYAHLLLGHDTHSGIAVLLITTTYFEAIEQYETGQSSEGHSKRFFINGFNRVFPNIANEFAAGDAEKKHLLDVTLGDLYKELRCALSHGGMIRGRTLIMRHPFSPITIKVDDDAFAEVQIDPGSFVGAVEGHFSDYLTRVREPTNGELRQNFERTWNAGLGQGAPTVNYKILNRTYLGTSVREG